MLWETASTKSVAKVVTVPSKFWISQVGAMYVLEISKKKDLNSGRCFTVELVTSHRKIAYKYLTGWFLVVRMNAHGRKSIT